jgi:hypothetical protein
VVESALLQGEGRLPEAAAVLDKALGGAGGAAGGDEAASGGAAVCWEWIVAEVRLHLGLATLMLAEAAGEGGAEQDPLLTNLGRQLLRVSLDHSERSCAAEERAEGDGGGASDSDGSDGEGEEALPSERALNAMKVPQLKALLAERDLPTSGKKADLIARLLGAAPAAPAGSPPSHTAAARKKVGKGKGAQGSRESRQAGAGGGTPEVTGAGRERGLRLLMSSWQALHPAGPPLLIRRCGRALAQVKRVCVCVCVCVCVLRARAGAATQRTVWRTLAYEIVLAVNGWVTFSRGVGAGALGGRTGGGRLLLRVVSGGDCAAADGRGVARRNGCRWECGGRGAGRG